MIYLALWTILYIIYFMNYFSKYKGIFFYIQVIILFSIVIIIRGDVGTDTMNYQYLAKTLDNVFEQMEIGYSFLIMLIKFFISDEVIIIRIVGFLFSILFIYIYLTGSTNERFIIFYFLLPAYFLPYGMNVIRIGFASLLFYLAVRSFFDKNFFKMLIIIIISILFHYSILIAYLFFILIYFKIVTFRNILILILISAIFYVASFSYLSNKVILYSSYDSPMLFSGISSVIVIFLLILSIYVSNINKTFKKRVILITLLLTILFYFIKFYSYAGLRLLEVLKYSLPVIYVFILQEDKKNLNLKSTIFIVLAGFVSVCFMYKDFLETEGNESGFLPYTTFFE